MEEEELPYIKQLRWSAFICLLFSLALLSDILLPFSCEQASVTKRFLRKEVARFGVNIYELTIFTDKHAFKADPPLFELAKEGELIEVCTSGLFGKVLEVSGTNSQTLQHYQFKIINSAYRGYGSFPITLLILSCITAFFKKDETIAYSAGIIMIVIAITLIILMTL